MSIAIATSENPCTEAIESQVANIRRTAFYIESQGEPLFAWLHHPDGDQAFDHGVVICSPVGYEQLHAHRALRHLADALADQKIPVLRFDYHGTGDSAGVDEDPNRIDTWLTNIRDATAWMRQQLGCRAVSLLGVRMGATLAMLAADEDEVDNLVLWAPVIKGRAYVRELKALSLTADAAVQASRAASDNIEGGGFVLTKETAHEISQLDLLRCTPRCRRALIVSRDDVAPDTRLLSHLSSLAIDAQQAAQPGFAEMMAEPHFTQVPQCAIDDITTWLRATIAFEGTRYVALNLAAAMPTTAVVSTRDQIFLRERTCRISLQPDLFGIMSEPEQVTSEDLPLVVLLNAGCSYRIGPGRLHVHMARRLAAIGFRCLRMDLGGLGDSVATNAAQENDSYAASAFRDIDLVLTYAKEHVGAQRVVLMGLCSGAYTAFQSATQLPDPMLVESVLINPLTFFWKEGMTLDTATTNRVIAWHYYLSAIVNPKKWTRLLAGKSRLGFTGAIRRLIRRRSCQKDLPRLANATAAGVEAGTEYSHPLRNDLPADLDRVIQTGRQLALVCSVSDPGHFILMFNARRKAKQMQRMGRLNTFFIVDADHTFSTAGARDSLIRTVCQHLRKRYHDR